MHARTYVPLFTTHIIPNYKKGEMPFTLTVSHRSLLFSNLNNPENHYPCGLSSSLIKASILQ